MIILNSAHDLDSFMLVLFCTFSFYSISILSRHVKKHGTQLRCRCYVIQMLGLVRMILKGASTRTGSWNGCSDIRRRFTASKTCSDWMIQPQRIKGTYFICCVYGRKTDGRRMTTDDDRRQRPTTADDRWEQMTTDDDTRRRQTTADDRRRRPRTTANRRQRTTEDNAAQLVFSYRIDRGSVVNNWPTRFSCLSGLVTFSHCVFFLLTKLKARISADLISKNLLATTIFYYQNKNKKTATAATEFRFLTCANYHCFLNNKN